MEDGLRAEAQTAVQRQKKSIVSLVLIKETGLTALGDGSQ